MAPSEGDTVAWRWCQDNARSSVHPSHESGYGCFSHLIIRRDSEKQESPQNALSEESRSWSYQLTVIAMGMDFGIQIPGRAAWIIIGPWQNDWSPLHHCSPSVRWARWWRYLTHWRAGNVSELIGICPGCLARSEQLHGFSPITAGACCEAWDIFPSSI